MNLKFFSIDEFDCQETGNNQMEEEFLESLDNLRGECGFPFIITSGYRDPSHSLEIVKKYPGTHTQGIAADISITDSAKRHLILKKAFEHGFTGIGIADTFIHLDMRLRKPVVWTY